MPEKHFCAHCDQEFVPETDEDKPRCPTCMRRGAVQVVQTTPDRSGAQRKKLLAVIVLLVVAGIGYGAYRSTVITLQEVPPVRPLEVRELSAYLERDQITVGTLEGMFVLPATGDWPSEADMLVSSIRDKSSSWPLDHPLPREVYTADETLAALEGGDEPPRLYPLEAALAMTALLREQGVRAMVAETWDLAERAPPDPSGLFGYFLVATYDGDAEEPGAFFDPWGGRREVSPSSVRVLRDTETIAAALGTNAMRISAKSGDGERALPLVETALLLDPVSPNLRSVHARVLLNTGGPAMGAREFEAALQLRPDGPRQLNLVQLALAQAAMLQMGGEVAAAQAELSSANRSISAVIEKWPAYARAHLALAMLHFGIGEPERARAELEVAQRLSPASAELWALWGQYYLSQGDYVSAVARVKRAVELDPENWQLRLQAAGALLEAGDEESGRAQVEAAIALVPASKRDELRQYLSRAFGSSPGGGFALPEPSVGGSSAAPVPTDNDPAFMLGDPSDLRLRSPDQDLQLDLRD